MIESLIAAEPPMARFVEQHSPVRFRPCSNYLDNHPGRSGSSAGGRALDITPVSLEALTPLALPVVHPRARAPSPDHRQRGQTALR
jgi:hypothetical protein